MAYHFISSHAEPRITAVILIQVRKIGFVTVRYIEQVAQCLYLISLFSFRKKLAHRQAQILSQKIQERALDRPLCLYHELQLADIQSLNSFPVILCSFFAASVDGSQYGTVLSDFLSHYQRNAVCQALTGIFPTVDLTDTGVARTVL